MFTQFVNISLNNVLKTYKKLYLIHNEIFFNEIAVELHFNDQESELIELIVEHSDIKIFKGQLNNGPGKFLLVASLENMKFTLDRLSLIDNRFDILKTTVESYLKIPKKHYEVNNKILDFSEPLVMGILNVTPDSFFDGGRYSNIEEAMQRSVEMIELGVDIIDIGGESSRPGANSVSSQEEIRRVIPVIKLIREYSKDIFISTDTTKPEVAAEALKFGADIINDISGNNYSSNMKDLIRDYDVPYILMHMKGTPKNMQENPHYDDVVSEIYEYFYFKIEELHSLGFEKIIIDPGVGFGKRVSDNYEIIQRLNEFKGLGKPIAIGISNKSLIGKPLKLNLDERTNATTSLETICLLNGANIIRTHNVKNAVEQKKIYKFISNPNELINV
ncbi:MAG: dihydropteroate synthase [Ignavibacteriales bacterium]|nr:dihydropteroate synthase [Ignavibacteriales bacterium]